MVRHVPSGDEVRNSFHESIAHLVNNAPYVFFWGVSDSDEAPDYLVVTQPGGWEEGFLMVGRLEVDRPEWLNDARSRLQGSVQRIREFLCSPTSAPFHGVLTWSSSEGTFLCDTLPSVEFDLIAPRSVLREHHAVHGATLRIARQIKAKCTQIRDLQSQIDRLESEVQQLRDEMIQS